MHNCFWTITTTQIKIICRNSSRMSFIIDKKTIVSQLPKKSSITIQTIPTPDIIKIGIRRDYNISPRIVVSPLQVK